MPAEWMDQALGCFEPAPSPDKIPQIRAELSLIADYYALNARSTHLSHAPFKMAGETDEQYQERLQALPPPPKTPGRPRRLAAQILVASLRDLLKASGCHYGAPKPDDRRSRLEELARTIHLAVGPKGQNVGWRSIAERMAEPLFQMEVLLGPALKVEGDRSKINEMLKRAEQRPPKNPNKTN